MDEVNKSGPYYEAVSLCYFNGNDSGWSWTRVADIKNGELTTFLYNPDEPYFYENRNFLIDKTGKVHTKGDLAVFAWSDSPNASGSDKPFNDATELKDFPIHVFKLSAKNTLQVIDNLRNGVSCGSTSHDVMYIFCESDEGLQGVLCPAQSMEERNQQYFLKDSVSKLPYYLLKSSDILSISDLKNPFGNEKYVFLKALVPGTPISYLPTRETSAIIKDVILKNRFLTWNSFRNFTSNAEGSHKYTQKELRVFKECLAQVQCKTVQEELAAELGCTVSEATTYIENFIENANSYLEGDEVDTQLLSRLVMANDELREKYTALVEEKWKTDASEKINIAAQKVEKLENQCKKEANTLKSLNSDIEDRRDKLRELQDEVAQNKILARESYSMVQEKIATAKHDVSSFLADMACYFPNSTVIANSSASTSGDYVNGAALESDKVETFDSWESLVDELRSNLGCVGVAQEYERSLAAFLYATHHVRMPLLLAGYIGEEIGQALSVSVFGKYADILTCSGNGNLSMIHDAFSGEGILLIRNPFCGDWLNALLQETKASHKHIIFCHPYTEDLTIEPQSLFNYMLPVFTDQITDSAPNMEDMIGARLKQGEDDFEPAFGRIVSNNVFSELGISKILQNKMQSLFASTQSITKVKEDSLIYRCILTSYAASAEKGEQLCRAIKGRTDLSQDIKKFIFRYFNYEEE
jgi:hypothetical protein